MQRLITIIAVLIFFANTLDAQEFKMQWSGPERIWLGEETWANRLQDWKIYNNELHCIVSDWNRNINLLTWRLSEKDGSFKVSTEFRLLNTERSSRNWVGVRIASRGRFNDYRDDAIFGKGLDIGVTTNGEIFFDKPSEKYEKNAEGVFPFLGELAILQIDVEQAAVDYIIKVSLFRKSDNKLLAHETYVNIHASDLFGSLALVSHFPESDSKNKPSVAFASWSASGSKLVSYPQRSFGPILFAQHTLSRDVLKMSAQMPPMGSGDDRYVSLEIFEGGE
ncbi:MAG: hypothetical protein QNK33_08640, partial [Bacteroidales bacterium]|nr:hypothetical protein [Bacteroidales bacterium]